MVSLLTNTPEYFADLCDEIRLFFDVRRIPAAQQVGGQGFFVVHAMQKGETFRHHATLYRDGQVVAEAVYETPSRRGGRCAFLSTHGQARCKD
ncbi:MAG: hypothetical protein V8Q43_00035 [Christensenellaceae bacterium]